MDSIQRHISATFVIARGIAPAATMRLTHSASSLARTPRLASLPTSASMPKNSTNPIVFTVCIHVIHLYLFYA